MRKLVLFAFLLALVVPIGAQEYRIKAPAGSVMEPGIAFPGPATGIYSPGTGNVALTADGVGNAILTSTLIANAKDRANSIWATSNRLDFEGATEDAYETEIAPTDPTADRLITLPDATGTVKVENVFNYNILDSGGAGAATYTLQPAGYSLATLSCADADGCTVTMGETGLVSGASITIIQIVAGSGNITIVDDDGTTAELDGDANLTLNVLDSVTLHYVAGSSTWIETAYIDIS